ncbi:MAG: right-handed parallel beta-helix repeat-containing protein [Candidatus Sericytochromatia bacterium]|nr:right-handed parallel beta-helix repeat-containing protein [Candidatus Sericytochromatia bacterium]
MLDGWLVALFALLSPVGGSTAPAGTGRLLEVGPGDTIQSVLWQARSGDRIRISGPHEERIFPTFDITLEAGEDGLLMGRDGPALTIGAGMTVRIAGLGLQRRDSTGLPGGPVISVRDGQLLAIDARIIADSHEALRVSAHGSAELKETLCRSERGTALRVGDHSVVQVEGGRIEGGPRPAVLVSELGRTSLTGCRISGRDTLVRLEDDAFFGMAGGLLEGGKKGLVLAQRATARLHAVSVEAQQEAGLALTDKTDLAVNEATVSPKTGVALALGGDARLISRRTTWTGSPARAALLGVQAVWLGLGDRWTGWTREGVTVADHAVLAHRGLVVRQLPHAALQVSGGSRVLLDEPDVQGLSGDGIVLVDDARLSLKGGRFTQIGRDVVVAEGRSRVTLENIEFNEGRRHAVVCGDEARVLVRGGQARGFREAAMMVRGKGQVRLEGVRLIEHLGIAALAIGDGRLDLDNCDLRGGRQGLAYLGRSTGEVISCRIFDHKADGVTVQDMARPVLRGIEIRGQGQAGLRVLDGARPLLERSVLAGNEVGLSVEAPGHTRGQPLLGLNRVSGNRFLDHEGLLPGPMLRD